MNREDIYTNYVARYKPLIVNFIEKIDGLSYENIPEPHFPVIGSEYHLSKDKIVFIGIDTKGYGNIADFIQFAKEDISSILLPSDNAIDSLEYLNWKTNFGNNFWSFILKFLWNFYELNSLECMFQDKYQYLLKSFIWANSNSIQSLNLNNSLTDSEDYKKIKQASLIFDNAKLIIETFEPSLLVITNWSLSEKYLLQSFDFPFYEEKFEEYISVFSNVKYSKTKVVWTAHPTFLNKRKEIKFDNFISNLAEISRKSLLQ